MKYAALFAKLHLSTEQIAKFEANVMAREEAQMDLQSAATAQHLAGQGPEAMKLYNQNQSAYMQSQIDLLGTDGFQALQQFDQQWFPRGVVASLAGAAVMESIPISPEQTEQLNAAVIAGFQSPQGKSAAVVDWTAIDRQAASILTPQQLQLFQQGEVMGPFGIGSRYQAQLNALITKGDQEDHAVATASP